MDGLLGAVILVDSDVLDGWVAGCRPGMDSNALGGRVAGCRNPRGLQCSGRTGCRVS